MLSRRLQRILAKKKKFQSGRRHFKKNKDFKKSDGKDQKKGEPICDECKKPGHIKAECPKLKKPKFRKRESSKKFRRHKKKAMAAAWSNSSDSDSESSSNSEEEEAYLAFMANTEEKAITLRPRHRLPPDLKPSTSTARNFLRVSPSTTLPDLQNLFLLDSMASSTVSGSVGGYGAAFLTAEEQTRFASVKAKLRGHKAVDLENLEKNGVGSLVEALQRLKWTKIATLSDVSYPDLVKGFYVCLKTEEDGTLTSMVKGTQIRITRELLASLFEVSTSGRSGVHTVDTHAKGLGIIGLEYRLKDGKLDINQLSAFNRLLHFIICQIIVPRSATFSSCTKADSDLMFWAIQNQEINTAELIMERMRFARSQVWDIKSKLNISLPYAHLLTRIFHHFGISVVGDVSEKMGQAIRSRNLRKSGFSVVNGVWSKTGTVEGEAILGETQEDHEPVAEAAAVAESATAEVVQVVPAAPAVEEPAVAAAPAPEAAVVDESSRRIEDIPPEDIDPIGQFSEVHLPSSQVGSLLRDALDSISQGEPVAHEPSIEKSVAKVPIADVVMEEALSQQEQVQVQEDVVMEDAPIEGEQSVAEEIQGVSVVASGHTEIHSEVLPVQEEEAAAAAQTEVPMESVHAEGEAEVEKASSSYSEDDQDQQPQMDKAQEKGKVAEVPDVPLLDGTPHQRQMRQRVIINLKPVIERLDAQGEILCSVQSDVNSIFMSQASTSKELSQVKNVVRWFNKELGSMKTMLSEILKAVGAQAPPPPPPAAQRSEEDVPRPSGPDEQVAGPSGPTAASPQAEVSGSGPSGPDEQVSGPSGQAEVSGSGLSGPAEKVSRPSGPLESESVQHIAEEAEAVAPEPPAPSSTEAPVPSSPPSSSTAPPAPQTFKKPQPRTISSPTPFPSQSTSSPASSTPISPPPPIFEVPPVSSSAGASSSSGPPSSGPSDIPPTISHSLLHPSPPPSFITVIPEGAQLESPYHGKIKDEFEEVILRSVLKKEIKMARHFQLFNNYRYVHRLPEVQFSQFKQAIDALGSTDAHTEAIQVDFATLQVLEEILLPPIHSLVMDSSVGSIIFERFARVMGRIKVQKGFQVAFHRFLFREYHQGHVSAEEDLVVSRVCVCPSGVKEDLEVSRVLFLFGLRREDQLSWVLYKKKAMAASWDNSSDSDSESSSSNEEEEANLAFMANVKDKASSDDPLLLGGSLDLGEGFPNIGLKLASTENQEEWCFGGFLGLPKESFINLFDPFEDLFRGKYPIHFVHVDV
ncbi:hypothetical protein Taro_033740 [Colocasia esculenta]|uniref:CCHC-type domain-containing protein n=1 Tax=Colocasia esculenta TaxID=4460 RepID=A0A843W5K5_COLES|nr:hypothetical protein [Colocasia esculenta]